MASVSPGSEPEAHMTQQKKRKAPARTPGEAEEAPRRGASEREERPEDVDPREEEGWSQPESSAQKLPPGADSP
jgi:hypothetical protein